MKAAWGIKPFSAVQRSSFIIHRCLPVSSPTPAKLMVGLLSADPALFDAAEQVLRPAYGPADFRSEVFQWEITRYYEQEMGARLLRQFMSFERLISPAALADLKRHTNRLEQSFARPANGQGRPPP